MLTSSAYLRIITYKQGLVGRESARRHGLALDRLKGRHTVSGAVRGLPSTHLEGKDSKCARMSAAASASTFIPRARRLAIKLSAISVLLRRLRLPWLAKGGAVGGSWVLMLPAPPLQTRLVPRLPARLLFRQGEDVLPTTRVVLATMSEQRQRLSFGAGAQQRLALR